jgi:hypothetical protein
MAHALIGPDVTIRALCASPARAPIASVSEEGLGVVDWSVTLRGDPTFGADGPFGTCAKTRTQVATVTFDPPPDATPGRTFDTVATVSSQNGAFADGTVNVHGLIVAASASTSTTTLDFGDVAPGAAVSLPLRFALSSDQVVLTVRIDNLPVLFVIQKNGGLIQSTVSAWTVTFTAPAAPGSYTDMLTFDAVPGAAPDAGPECTWTQVISLRARVVAAGADGGTRG